MNVLMFSESNLQASNTFSSPQQMFHHQTNQTDELVSFRPKVKLKRKHASRADVDHDSADEMYNDEESSNSSYSSSKSNSTEGSCFSSSSSTLSVKKTHHGHKVHIAEQKMSDALSRLQIDQIQVESPVPVEQQDVQIEGELEERPSTKSHRTIIDNLDDSDEFELGDDNVDTGNIVVSNELKQKLKEFKFEDFLINNLNKNHQPSEIDSKLKNMQVMLWLPKNSSSLASQIDENDSKSSNLSYSSSDSNTSTIIPNDNSTSSIRYKVEEPSDASSREKSKLKRSFSQVNRISIEELKPNHFNPFFIEKFGVREGKQSEDTDKIHSSVQFYLVDEEVDKKSNELTSKNINSSLNITELDNDEETMEF